LKSPEQHPYAFPPYIFLHFRFLTFSPLLFNLDLSQYLWDVQKLFRKVEAGGERNYKNAIRKLLELTQRM